ncbi:MAG TPA: RIO1 family regulatory kinase/ATPase [Actinomycetota bacterium]
MDIERLDDDEVGGMSLDHFLAEGLITDVVRIVKTGKEASVHLCRGNRSTTGEDLVALKLYHPLDRRDFRDESIYRDGEWIGERRIRAALEKKTRFGRQVQGGLWVSREWETLRALSRAGLPVPRPIARTDDAILMGYIGDLEVAAPQLRSVRPDAVEAQDLFDQALRAIERMLYVNVIHGDLSAYNLLLWDGLVTVIDLPQAIDPRKNRHAHALLERDVTRICEHFERLGVRLSPHRLATDLWTAWQFADLVPEGLRTGIEM